jgi:hypothetical protein
MSLEIKEVIQVARAQFKELLPELSIDSTDVRLEEIEREGENWAVTLSVPNTRDEPSLLGGVLRGSLLLGRVAKVIVVNGADGKFIALRQRAA